MHPLLRVGRIIFAIALIADAGLQINIGQFIICRPPEWPFSFGGSTIWAYVSAGIFIATAIVVIINNKFARPLLLISGALIILYTVCPFLRGTITDAFQAHFRTNEFKCLAMSGGMFMLAASFSKEPMAGLVWTGRILLALFFIIAGIQHFQFDKFVEDLIPAFIPAHAFWTYFAAIALIAGGIGVLVPSTARLAATLSGIMLFSWVFLVHIPLAINTHTVSEVSRGFQALQDGAVAFMLAGVSRGRKP